jgi:hypothetical protein
MAESVLRNKVGFTLSSIFTSEWVIVGASFSSFLRHEDP